MLDFFNKIENKGMQNSNFISYVRLLTTFLVIINHIYINCIKDFPGAIAPSYNIITYDLFMNYVMFMITGYTFMKIKQHMTIKMSISMVIRYYVAMMLFSIPFSVMELVYKSNYVINVDIIKAGFFNALNGITWDHLWYIYVLLIVYLLFPFLSRIYKSENNLLLPFFMLILFIMLIFDVRINISSKIYMFNWVPFSYVLFAVTFGAMVYRYNMFEKIKWWMLIIFLLVSWFFWFKLGKESIILTMINGMSIFLLFKKLFIKKNAIINYLSTFAFPIYIIHVLFLHIITKILKINPYSYGGYFGAVLFTVIIYSISLLFSVILKKMPYIKNLYI